MADRVPKKRKRSGCSTIELIQYLDMIKQILDGIASGDPGDEQSLSEDVPDLLSQVVDKMETQLELTRVA